MSERRSIDYIPESERHGHPFSQFTLWFGGNLQITAIVTGALAVVLGGDVVWSLVGLLVGQMLGAAVMSLGTVAKLAMRQPFVLFKGLTFQKLCLPGAFRPGDHHNKMLRPGLCVVHASPQYL
ncbi:hypothetical protein HJW83_15450 [Klebsiella pneumoniae]|nr:hypothetical protein HJW83_15450 [Klebsiella pneumoniae]